MKVRHLAALAGLALPGTLALADQVMLPPAHDATIYFDPLGDTANGSGEYLFAGNAGTGEARRALIRFDLSAIPPGSVINQVTLKLTLSRASGFNNSFVVSLKRLTHTWNEGPSDAPDQEGMGTPAMVGDSTWLHSYYDTQFWATPGGDFVSNASCSLSITDATPQTCTFGPTPIMAADVQGWLNSPATNFGWIMIGDESVPGTARRFNSRENSSPLTRPSLVVTFTPPSSCYPNCDHSTATPFLNVQDFSCFLTKYAAGDTYANCDGSTTPPTLNVQDFSCFLQKYASGCSAP